MSIDVGRSVDLILGSVGFVRFNRACNSIIRSKSTAL